MTTKAIDLDPGVRPQDDFHGHVNGRWIRAFVLPEDQTEATLFSLLAHEVNEDVARIIGHVAAASSGSAGPDTRAVADLYTSFMDEERIEERGTAVLAPDLAAVLGAPDRPALAQVLGRLQARGIGGLVEPSVAIDPDDPARHVLNLGRAGLGLPAASLYFGASGRDLRTRYAAHVGAMLALAGLPEAEKAAERVVQAETALAEWHTRADSAVVPADTGTCMRTVDGLAARRNGFPWATWLENFGPVTPSAAVRVRPEAFLPALEQWWSATDLESLRLWLAWRYVHEMAPFGPREVFAEHFRWYWRELTGARRPWRRRMRATAFVQTALGEALGERYLSQHLAPDTIRAVRELVDTLRCTYRAGLERADWMRADTRAMALAKLGAMRFEIGGPVAGTACVAPRTDPDDLIGNVHNTRAWRITRQLDCLDGPVDCSDWKVLPQAVTAYYRHGLNQVVIPAGLLRPPVFDVAGETARNFAVLGSIVCHEMSHAFYHRGAHHDERGRARTWWADEDRAEFARRTSLLVEQYDGYALDRLDGAGVSGERTLSENVADVTGLMVAQRAFAAHLDARGVTGEPYRAAMRRFFVLWASMWRAKRTRSRSLERLANDPHAPPPFRCNGPLGHVPAFYDAFSVTENDRMHIRTEARFTLLG